MSEISMYEAQKKKMQGLCDEHDLVYRFEKDRYPIIFTIKPVQGMKYKTTRGIRVSHRAAGTGLCAPVQFW